MRVKFGKETNFHLIYPSASREASAKAPTWYFFSKAINLVGEAIFKLKQLLKKYCLTELLLPVTENNFKKFDLTCPLYY